jgi:hypothetical protein
MNPEIERLIRQALHGHLYSDPGAFTGVRVAKPTTPPMTLGEKLKQAIFHHGNYFIMEMPAEADFLYHEGVAMQHCLEFCYREYAERMKSGSQRQFSLVDQHTGRPRVNIELSISKSSYSGPVGRPVVTQIRGVRNQCPPDDCYLPAIMAFLQKEGYEYVNHGIRNFDGQCDGNKVLDRWMEISEPEV